MKRHLLIVIILLLVACSPRHKDAKVVDRSSLNTVKADKSSIRETRPVVKDVVKPAGGMFSTGFKYSFFGKIGYMDRAFQEDTLVFPPIEGLIHNSVFVMCPKDTCFAERAVLALRCPPIQPLLDWVADTVNTFANKCPIGNGLLTYNEKQLDIPKKHFKTVKDISDYYIGHLQHAYDSWHCTGKGDHNRMNEQDGLLLADCWNRGNLYTFYRIDWYDWLSCGNNVRESWWTVNASTGNLMSIDDLVLPEMKDSLSTLMMPRLINGKGELLVRLHFSYTLEDKEVLHKADGCALIPEGLVIYYYPYNLGCGADGEFEAVIPYDKLDGILREPLSFIMCPYSEEPFLPSYPEEVIDHVRVLKSRKPYIDLFGVDLVGSPRHILQELNKGPYVQVNLGPEGFLHESEGYCYCEVLVDGIPFGMTMLFGKDEESKIVKDVHFITDYTDYKIIDIIVKMLTDYYG